ncbi:MAG: intracellular sulfur oxidation DsrE/DsrF family protein [Parasphingorhabdus sp.]|jgi:intracellular sulfur oxidation DsrE/DsrF family protein
MLNVARRKLWFWLMGAGGVLAGGKVSAHHADAHFDDDSSHHIVYQCNKADPEYISHILFSVSELLRKYEEDVEIVVACFGPGLHLLGKMPGRPIPQQLQDQASSQAEYGVSFHACGNTMNAVSWGAEDLLPFAEVVPIGVDDIMQLQEKGFVYMAW